MVGFFQFLVALVAFLGGIAIFKSWKGSVKKSDGKLIAAIALMVLGGLVVLPTLIKVALWLFFVALFVLLIGGLIAFIFLRQEKL